jgi:hypothetical protein
MVVLSFMVGLNARDRRMGVLSLSLSLSLPFNVKLSHILILYSGNSSRFKSKQFDLANSSHLISSHLLSMKGQIHSWARKKENISKLSKIMFKVISKMVVHALTVELRPHNLTLTLL